MKKKQRTETITRKVTVYIADDGKEFDTEGDCKSYEYRQVRSKAIEAAEKLRLKEFDEELPLSNSDINENNTFRWYRLKNETDYDVVQKAYNETFEEPQEYPELMCVETCGYEPYEDDAYCYYLSDCKRITEHFWKKFGYKVTFEKE